MIKVTTLKNIFDIQYGSQLDLNKLDITDDKNGINFVNRSANNLGISCKVEKLKYKNVFEKGLLTVALGGSILETFVQPEQFYTGQNVKVLTPKIEMSFNQKIYYAMCIKANAFRYSTMGREANTSLNDILVPAIDSIPNWVEKISVPHVSEKPVHKKSFGLNVAHWKEFSFHNFFDIQKGRETLDKLADGNTKIISSTAHNNGVSGFQDYGIKMFSKNKITVNSNGSIGKSFYQEKEFYATGDVNILVPKFRLTPYIAFFLITIISQEKYRYNYGRKWGKQKMEKDKIKLPVDKNGNPDWQFMEDYIKSLPYSSNL